MEYTQSCKRMIDLFESSGYVGMEASTRFQVLRFKKADFQVGVEINDIRPLRFSIYKKFARFLSFVEISSDQLSFLEEILNKIANKINLQETSQETISILSDIEIYKTNLIKPFNRQISLLGPEKSTIIYLYIDIKKRILKAEYTESVTENGTNTVSERKPL